MEMTWSEPRVALHPRLGQLVMRQAVEDLEGVRKLTVSTAEWREYGLWLQVAENRGEL